MRKFGVCLALMGAAVGLTGCGMQFGSSSSSRGGIAVVDLDRVAAETNKTFEMKEQYELQENSYKQALLKGQAELTAQLKAKVEDLKEKGEEATDDAKRQVGQFQLDANRALAQAQNAAGSKLGQYKQEQIAKFRAELKPILQETAAKRGMAIVIPKNDGLLLSVDPGVDITDDVIKAYREKKPAPAAPAAQTAAKAPEAAKQAAPKTAAKAPEALRE